MDLYALTDDQLSDHLNAVLAEQERRQRLANIPGQISSLAAQYVAGGGDKSDLEVALGEARPAAADQVPLDLEK